MKTAEQCNNHAEACEKEAKHLRGIGEAPAADELEEAAKLWRGFGGLITELEEGNRKGLSLPGALKWKEDMDRAIE